MAKKSGSRVGSFRGKISSNDARKKRGSAFSYISAPSGVELFAPEAESEYTFDFIPYQVKMKTHPDRDDKNGIAAPGDWWYKLPFRVHKDVGVQNVKTVCPQSFGKPCPICEYRAKLKKEDGDEDEIKSLNTSERNLYAIKPRANKKLKDAIYLYDASDFKFQEVFRSQLKRDERWETFPHPEEGCSLKVVYDEGTFAGFKYAEPTRFDFVDRKHPLDDSLLDEVPNLEECLIVLSYEELKAKFFDAEIADDDDEEDERPAKKVVKEEPATRKRKPVQPEPEEDEDEDEDEEDDEVSLEEEITACKSVGALLTIATNNAEFKSSLKSLNKIVKTSELKKTMLEILEPEEEEEEDDTNVTLVDVINEAETVSDLLGIAKENPEVFKASIKKLREFNKVRLIKERMLELVEESEEEEEEEEVPVKKQKGDRVTNSSDCPSGYRYGTDNDEKDECDACPVWNPCYKKSKEK